MYKNEKYDFEKDINITFKDSKIVYNPKIKIDNSNVEDFYEFILKKVASRIGKTGLGYEVEMPKCQFFKHSLEKDSKNTIGELKVEKLYQGHDKFFQMAYMIDEQEILLTFKPSINPECDFVSAIVQPRKRVIINGYGTIGKKVADLVRKSGFEIVAVTNTGYIDPNGQAKYMTYDAIYKGYPLYLVPGSKNSIETLINAGVPYQGTLTELLEKMRQKNKKVIIIDASVGGKDEPKTRTGYINLKTIYEPYSDIIEALIFQGGEDPIFVSEGRAFSSETTDFNDMKGKKSAEVVSCNTTGFNRIFKGISDAIRKNNLATKITIDSNALRREMDPGADKIGIADHLQIEGSIPNLSKDVGDYLSKPVNIDRVFTSAKGFYLHMATVSGITDTDLTSKLILVTKINGISFEEFEGKKLKTSELYKMLEEKYKNTIGFKVVKSDIPNEVKILFGYSMRLSYPAEEDLGAYGLKMTLSSFIGMDDVKKIDDIIYVPTNDFISPNGGITQASTHHTATDFKMTLTKEYLDMLSGTNSPASSIPTTHFHINVATIRADGLTADMVRESLQMQSRIALVHFIKSRFSSSKLYEVINSSVSEEVKGGNHPMVIIAQVTESQIPGEIKIIYAVPQESDVIPESVNALHAMLGLYSKKRSMEIVNEVGEIARIKCGIEARFPDLKLKIKTENPQKIVVEQ